MSRSRSRASGGGKAAQGHPQNRPAGSHRTLWAWWLLTAAGLATAWLGFHSWKPPNFILIPIEDFLPVAPLYAFLMPEVGPFVLVALAVLGVAAWGWRRLPEGDARIALLFLLAFAFTFRLAVHAGRSGTLPGAELGIPHGEEVIYDVPRIESAGAFLRDYTTLQPDLSLHGRTKPPGFALFLYGLTRWLGFGWTALGTVLTLVGSAIVIPVFFLRAAADDEEKGASASMMIAVLPAAVLYGAVTLDALFAVVAGTALALAWRQAARPHAGWPLLLGLVLFLAMMLSYSAFVLAAFVLLLLGICGWRRAGLLALHVGMLLVTFLASFVILYLATGFDGWECFRTARSLNTGSMSFVTGRNVGSFEVWLYTSLGNALAFFLFLGVPLVAGLFRFPWREAAREERALALAFVGTLTLACFGGMYLMETGRIFLFLTPPAVALAVRSRGFPPTAALACLGLQAIVFELLLFTIW